MQVALDLQTAGNGMVRGAGADCRGNCHVMYNTGAAVHLEAIPDSGYAFTGWSGACSGGSACDLTLSANASAVATFNVIPPKMHRLAMAVDNSGSVTSQPGGINCPGSACSADFGEGTTVKLTAVPASGWVFTGWSGACSGASDCLVKMDGDVTVLATFNPPPPAAKAHLIVSVEGNGQISGSGINCGFGSTACDVTVDADTRVSLIATPRDRARFMGWGGACSGTGTSCGLVANGELRVTARFWDVLTTLVANDGTIRPVFAINSTDVFYARVIPTSADAWSIWAVSKSGGQPRKVASGVAIGDMVADDAYVYWTDQSSVYSAPVGGGSASQIFSGTQDVGFSALALDADDALYFSNYFDDSTGRHANVNRMQNRVTTVLVANTVTTRGIAVDDKYVYFGATDANRNGFLQRVLKTGGPPDTMNACGQYCYISAIKADGTSVFFNNLQRADAFSIPKAGGPPTLLSTRNDSAGAILNGLDANGGAAYWTTVASYGDTVSGVFSANADGSNWTALDTGADNAWYGPRVDDTAVYYLHLGSLQRRLK